MTVVVRFLGGLQRLTGHRETRAEVPPGTPVVDLLGALAERYGPEFAAAIFRAPREVHTYLRVFVDEEEVGVSEPVAGPGEGAPTLAVLVLPVFEGGSR